MILFRGPVMNNTLFVLLAVLVLIWAVILGSFLGMHYAQDQQRALDSVDVKIQEIMDVMPCRD
jgi:quinol-cytochrome oxidoreductase complex cytochrome b subunit